MPGPVPQLLILCEELPGKRLAIGSELRVSKTAPDAFIQRRIAQNLGLVAIRRPNGDTSIRVRAEE
jgi:hypothetical protein